MGRADAAGVWLVPVRHHSPACARMVRTIVRQIEPRAVLIEGPADANTLVPLLVDEATCAPVALYASVELARGGRSAATYPLCDYSPELVALREGHAGGAALRFIDLPYGEKMRHPEKAPGGPPRSLLEAPHLAHGAYVNALAEREGCRDSHELWDHLFEEGSRDVSALELRARVAAWCALARVEHEEDALEADGTLARERYMAWAIAEERKRGGPLVVVTGGFHTVALAPLVARDAPAPAPSAVELPAEHYLVRYGFAQLDAYQGYGAGMPSPWWYQRQWEEADEGDPLALSAELLVELGRQSRSSRGAGVSAADELAALAQVAGLAQLRGHVRPTREDLLDGLRSTFVKGPLDERSNGALVAARTLLAGDRIGAVPDAAGAPPLVADVREPGRACRPSPRTAGPARRRARHLPQALASRGEPLAARPRAPRRALRRAPRRPRLRAWPGPRAAERTLGALLDAGSRGRADRPCAPRCDAERSLRRRARRSARPRRGGRRRAKPGARRADARRGLPGRASSPSRATHGAAARRRTKRRAAPLARARPVAARSPRPLARAPRGANARGASATPGDGLPARMLRDGRPGRAGRRCGGCSRAGPGRATRAGDDPR